MLRDDGGWEVSSILQQEGYKRGGNPIYVVVSVPLLMPASVLSDFAATTSTTFESPLQGSCELQAYLALGKLLPRQRTEESLTDWERVGLYRHPGEGLAGKRGDPGGRER